MKSLKLPKSTFAFEKIITKRYYYVDKTPLIHKMLTDEDGYCFLSRPRRFGKSLLVDTLHCLFKGKKELFKDLYIYDKWDFDKNTHPVVRIDFSEGGYKTDNGLEDFLLGLLSDLEDDHQLLDVPYPNNYNYRLKQIIKKLYKKHNKQVVILIDEYDSPILDALVVDQKIAEANRSMLSDFFRVLKANNKYIRFLFITGISMFSKANMTSGLNNLTDISLDPKYATICGFTEKELKSVFAPELQNLKNISFAKIKKYYNGYNWSGDKQNKVYNPFGIVNLFSSKFIDSWWYDTCEPYFLYSMLKDKHITPQQVGNEWVNRGTLKSLEISYLDYNSLLFQMGVLTIVDKKYFNKIDTAMFLLDYPNFEVKSSFASKYVSYLIQEPTYKLPKTKAVELIESLEKNDFNEFQQTLHSLFADIPFPWTKKPPQAKPNESEGFYASIVYVSFLAIGVDIHRERSSGHGISDIEVLLKNQVFIFELKLVKNNKIQNILDSALDQIEKRGYGDSHSHRNKKVFGIALAFDHKKSNVVGLQKKLIYDGSSKL